MRGGVVTVGRTRKVCTLYDSGERTTPAEAWWKAFRGGGGPMYPCVRRVWRAAARELGKWIVRGASCLVSALASSSFLEGRDGLGPILGGCPVGVLVPKGIAPAEDG